MAFGPFPTYAPPGVYVRTNRDANLQGALAGLRIPFIIGTGMEELEQLNYELIRGSSSTSDTPVFNEDPSEAWVINETNPANPVLGAQTGFLVKFRVRNYPIVDGQGFGITTNDPRKVTVTVNGTPVAVGGVQGSTGYVTLQVPTQPTDIVRVTYQFHRGDTAFNDDVSSQVTAASATLLSPGVEAFNVTAGVSDTFKLKVNGTSRTVVFVANPATTAAALKSQIDAAMVGFGLTTSVFTDNQGLKHVLFTSQVSLEVEDGNANGILGFTQGNKTARNQTFQVFNRPIVDGTSAGLTTTDPAKVVVKVNGIQVVASAVDGANGKVTLPTAPPPGSSVQVSYFANTWQDTFDYLPNTQVTTVLSCGISPGRSDYIQGPDFVVSNPTPDVSIIHWGASAAVASDIRTAGAEPFDDTQILPTLVDNQMFLAASERFVDTTATPAVVSSTVFVLPEIPTLGNGRDTPLGLPLYNSISNARAALDTNRPDLVRVWTGRTLQDALGRAEATVIAVDGVSRKVTLRDPVHPDHVAFATFYYNRLVDDTYTLTNKVAGPVGSGTFEVLSALQNKNLYQVKLASKVGFAQTIQWPRGVESIPDAFHTGDGLAVSETVTVTFDTAAASSAEFTNKGAEPYSLYTQSATWVTKLNLVDQSTNLVAATRGVLVGLHVPTTAGTITVPASPDNVLNLVVDTGSVTGFTGSELLDVTVALPVGAQTPAALVTAINAAIDAALTAELGPTVANLASTVTIGTDAVFILKTFSTPAALPGGFDAKSKISIAQGTAESLLGFATFQSASGSAQSINKPATLLGSMVGPFAITAGLNDTFLVRINGTDYTVFLPTGPAVTAAAVVAQINLSVGMVVASVGTLSNLDKVRLTSTTNTDASSLVILNGSGNSVLGFTENDTASQVRVTAQEVANSLMATAGFAADAIAFPATFEGQGVFLTIETLSTGVGASIAFANSANSAFNSLTGVSITPGLDGDNGENAHDIFVVTSNNPAGSAGEGTPGQTYTDERTGLRFSVLPASTGNYTPGGFFTLSVSPTFTVSPSIPSYAVPGLELLVTNTVNVGVNDTANLLTFDPSGAEPRVGDFYYISYRFLKQDYEPRIFQQLKVIEANFGRLGTDNPVTLGAYLALLNGAVLVGIKQVRKVVNTAEGSTQDYIAAIEDLATPLPGNLKPDILVPLNPNVQITTYLAQHCEVLSNERNQSERMGFFGFASGTIPTAAQAVAKGIQSTRMVGFYPDSAVITLSNELGESFESQVNGTFLAAAVAGAVVSRTVDVATPYTRRRIVGITRLPRILDPVEMNQTAVAGLTLLEDLDPVIRIRQGLTTDMSSILTRLPTVTQIADHVQQQSRATLDPFIGTKFLQTRANEVEVTMTALFRGLKQAEIVSAFNGFSAFEDQDDPTTLRFEGFYAPIFPLLYLPLTFGLRSRL